MEKLSFLGTVGHGKSVADATASYMFSITQSSKGRNLMRFPGKKIDYSVLVAGGCDSPYNPYSGRANLTSVTSDNTVIASTLSLPTEQQLGNKDLDLSYRVCACGNHQVSDREDLTKHCVLCGAITVEPTKDHLMVAETTYDESPDTSWGDDEDVSTLELGDTDATNEDEASDDDNQGDTEDEEGVEEESIDDTAVEEDGDATFDTDVEEVEQEDAIEEQEEPVIDEGRSCPKCGETLSANQTHSACKTVKKPVRKPRPMVAKSDAPADCKQVSLSGSNADEEKDIESAIYATAVIAGQSGNFFEAFDKQNDAGVREFVVTSTGAMLDKLGATLIGEPLVKEGDMVGQSVSKSIVQSGNVREGTVSVDMLEEGLDKNATVSSSELKFQFIASDVVGGSRWWAFVNSTPVAFATAQSAGKNGDIFHDQSGKFSATVAGVCQSQGIYPGLKMMGFIGTKVEVPVAQLVQTREQQAVATGRREGAAQLEEFQDKVWRALGTAAVGINKHFWAGKSNPIKAALFNSLSNLGILNAETVIDDAFARHGDEYHKLLVTQANDLMLKTAETFNEVTVAVASANYQRAATTIPVSAQMAAHLASNNVPALPTAPMTATSGGVLDDEMRHVFKGLSGRK